MKNSKVKSILGVSLAAILAIGSLTACGSTSSSTATESSAAESTAEVSTETTTESSTAETSTEASTEETADTTATSENIADAYTGTAELNIDYSKAVDPKGADIATGSFQATPEESAALADQMIGTQNQFEGMTIGFSQHRIAGSEWYEQLVDFAQAEADYLGVKLTILDANDDLNQQIADVETLINLGSESIIVNPYNSSNVGLDEIIAAGIPLTVVNQAVDFSGGSYTYVSADVEDSGYKTGYELARYYDEKNGWKDQVKALVLSSAPQEKESDLRRWGQVMGWTDYMLDKYGKNNLDIVAYQYYQWLPEPAMNVTLDTMQANPDIEVIFAACDGGAQGVEAALESLGKLGDVLVCSIDGRKSVLQWIKDGDKGNVCDAYNDPRQMGKWAVYMAALQASGVSTPATYYVMNDLVTIDNVDDYLDPNSTY